MIVKHNSCNPVSYFQLLSLSIIDWMAYKCQKFSSHSAEARCHPASHSGLECQPCTVLGTVLFWLLAVIYLSFSGMRTVSGVSSSKGLCPMHGAPCFWPTHLYRLCGFHLPMPCKDFSMYIPGKIKYSDHNRSFLTLLKKLTVYQIWFVCGYRTVGFHFVFFILLGF